MTPLTGDQQDFLERYPGVAVVDKLGPPVNSCTDPTLIAQMGARWTSLTGLTARRIGALKSAIRRDRSPRHAGR